MRAHSTSNWLEWWRCDETQCAAAGKCPLCLAGEAAVTQGLRGRAKGQRLCSPPSSHGGRSWRAFSIPSYFLALCFRVALATPVPSVHLLPALAAAPAAQAPHKTTLSSCSGLSCTGAESSSTGDSGCGQPGSRRAAWQGPAIVCRCLGAGTLQRVEHRTPSLGHLAGTAGIDSFSPPVEHGTCSDSWNNFGLLLCPCFVLAVISFLNFMVLPAEACQTASYLSSAATLS